MGPPQIDSRRSRHFSKMSLELRRSFRRPSEFRKMSTHSGMSYDDPYERPKRNSITNFFYTLIGKGGQDKEMTGGFVSLFARKLIPPLGFYRETDKYISLQKKFAIASDPHKREALETMWREFQKFQIRKRFRWPPNLFLKNFFWTTGYYADYQQNHRATRIKRPGDDSSDDEIEKLVGAFVLATRDGNDVNLLEYMRYKDARARKSIVGGGDYRATIRATLRNAPTEQRLFPDEEATKQAKAAQAQAQAAIAAANEAKAKAEAERQRFERERAERDRLDREREKEREEKARLEQEEKDRKREKRKSKKDRKAREAEETTVSEEVETTVEYQVIKDPNKKGKSKKHR